MEKNITPLPWFKRGMGHEMWIDTQPSGLDGWKICQFERADQLSGGQAPYVEANAAYIVHAANLYPELVEALETAESAIEEQPYNRILDDALAHIQTVLAKAKGGQKGY